MFASSFCVILEKCSKWRSGEVEQVERWSKWSKWRSGEQVEQVENKKKPALQRAFLLFGGV
tara:strand:- start:1657 stop:1839 length:183 start_codon:yes stop_codon:yes gene_type:complete